MSQIYLQSTQIYTKKWRETDTIEKCKQHAVLKEGWYDLTLSTVDSELISAMNKNKFPD